MLSFLISASPLGEMKVGLPYANAADLNPWAALLFCVAGNLLVFPIVDYVMTTFGNRLFKNKTVAKRVVRIRNHTKNKTKGLIQKYGFWGLMVFVMIPLPGTGAYLGTIAAYAFNIDKQKAFMSISVGVVLSGILLQAGLMGAFKAFEQLF